MPDDLTATITPDLVVDHVCAEVRAEIARQRVSQKSIAAALGITEGQLSLRLTGQVELKVGELDAIARALKKPVNLFWPDADLVPDPYIALDQSVGWMKISELDAIARALGLPVSRFLPAAEPERVS